jgi:ectoine hydroxylase-related dioxygenase (phytanoyl-CoA dioxygenase family)
MDSRQRPRNAALESDLSAIRRDGYTIIEGALSEADLHRLRDEVEPHLASDPSGRNNFEGYRTQRVYSLAGKGAAFADLVEHPRVLAICDALLLPNYLLTASQAICIHPGETAQPFHTDDSFYTIPRPRRAISVSTIWAVDAFTSDNGSTQIVPGSHRWGDEQLGALLGADDFVSAPGDRREPLPAVAAPERWGAHLRDVCMPAGSVVVFLGTLVHRGGGNLSDRPRLAISNQYCEPWARPQENFFLSIPPAVVAGCSERVQQLLGYSVHPPFMGHANGRHPLKALPREHQGSGVGGSGTRRM